jgi:hypothetical protein
MPAGGPHKATSQLRRRKASVSVPRRNPRDKELDKIADDAGVDILNKMVEAAKDGDMRAADLVLSRVWPVRKGRPIALTLPAIQSAADVVAAVGAVADAVGAGEITPSGRRTASRVCARESTDWSSRRNRHDDQDDPTTWPGSPWCSVESRCAIRTLGHADLHCRTALRC